MGDNQLSAIASPARRGHFNISLASTFRLFAVGLIFNFQAIGGAVSAQGVSSPSSKSQRLQQVMQNDVPQCQRKLGTLSIVNGDDSSAWTQNGLEPPEKLLRALVLRSGCFNLVDRGAGLNSAQTERDIGGNLYLQRRSDVGQGQVKAADYVLIAEIPASNSNASGSGLGVGIGALIGGIKSKKMEAITQLSLTSVRTAETIAVQEGYASKNNLSIGTAGFLATGGAVGGGYETTEAGRIVTLSFIQAYSRMVSDFGLINTGSIETAEASPTKIFSAQGSVAMRSSAAAGRIVRTLPEGAMVYPTGQKNGLWWEVADDNDNVGWVLNSKIAPYSSMETEVSLLTPGSARSAIRARNPTRILNIAAIYRYAKFDSQVVGRLQSGQTLSLTGNNKGKWRQINYRDDELGWIWNPKIADK